MTTGEGGMVTTHSEEEWRLLGRFATRDAVDDGGWLQHGRLGFNYRLDDISAALGIGQVEKLDEILALRARGRGALRRSCSPASTASSRRCADDDDHVRSWFVYVVKLPDDDDATAS